MYVNMRDLIHRLTWCYNAKQNRKALYYDNSLCMKMAISIACHFFHDMMWYPSLCYGDSNCSLLASTQACFSSLPSLCCVDSNCRLLACKWAFSIVSTPCVVETPVVAYSLDADACSPSCDDTLLLPLLSMIQHLSLTFSECFLFALSIIFTQYPLNSLLAMPARMKFEIEVWLCLVM